MAQAAVKLAAIQRMSETTKIEWADHTWSPWLGCEPVSPGCAHCYASAISKRAGRGEYRRGMPRTLTKDWKAPERWNKQAHALAALDEACGRSQAAMPRVFPSMCDPFDLAAPMEWREQFACLIEDTPNLTWLLLTKRPENVSKVEKVPDNVWLGVSVENQEQADKRIPILLSIPAKVRFVSAEPLLGPIDLGLFFGWKAEKEAESLKSEVLKNALLRLKDTPGIDWVITGGESGFNYRKMELAWMQSIHDQCRAAGVSCFIKQDSARFPGQQGRIPEELWKCKEFPK